MCLRHAVIHFKRLPRGIHEHADSMLRFHVEAEQTWAPGHLPTFARLVSTSRAITDKH